MRAISRYHAAAVQAQQEHLERVGAAGALLQAYRQAPETLDGVKAASAVHLENAAKHRDHLRALGEEQAAQRLARSRDLYKEQMDQGAALRNNVQPRPATRANLRQLKEIEGGGTCMLGRRST